MKQLSNLLHAVSNPDSNGMPPFRCCTHLPRPPSPQPSSYKKTPNGAQNLLSVLLDFKELYIIDLKNRCVVALLCMEFEVREGGPLHECSLKTARNCCQFVCSKCLFPSSLNVMIDDATLEMAAFRLSGACASCVSSRNNGAPILFFFLL